MVEGSLDAVHEIIYFITCTHDDAVTASLIQINLSYPLESKEKKR
jgi:hypothetical protein